ncbi:hypothetical protein CHARACLAT_010073 [Characodon lateralis]|uniref:Uncharacterized protein n=1 Tax=Characodon lateralis TaxID=208331 RepID=A0ABU7CMG5_9TELE|nr:hypothetical protein [Characodon lateralis]
MMFKESLELQEDRTGVDLRGRSSAVQALTSSRQSNRGWTEHGFSGVRDDIIRQILHTVLTHQRKSAAIPRLSSQTSHQTLIQHSHSSLQGSSLCF